MFPDKVEIEEYLLRDAASPVTSRELMAHFGIGENNAGEFISLLDSLTLEGRIVEIKGGRYAHPSRVGLVAGRLAMNRDGFGFVVSQNAETPDVFIGHREIGSAMHSDFVVARIERRGKKPSGRIIRILKRGASRIMGRLRMRKKYALVVPIDERYYRNVYVHRDDLGGAADGQIVQVEITSYPIEDDVPEGIVVHVLGNPGDEDTEAGAIALKHDVHIDFPEAVKQAAKRIPNKVKKADIDSREDLRGIPFVTIDGETAKDFDDAVQVDVAEDGTFTLRVAIADVSHYVKPGSKIDVEAYARGTSTYFPDRVFPMLPEELSNNLCSLVPREDRLAMVAEMEFSRGGRRKAERFFPATIRSVHRLTYSEVARVLDDPDSEEAENLSDISSSLFNMWELARVIRARRKERGSIDFDLPEAEIVLDLQGQPEDIVRSQRNRAHFLIEEFMIAANEAVAEFLDGRHIPAPFRVHEEPDEVKMEGFRRFIHNFGYYLGSVGKVRPADLQELASRTEGKPEERVISQMMLRSMKKAHYFPENLGHFGLASTHYLHFTSPIRRYPDLLVHRILKKAVGKGRIAKKYKENLHSELEEQCFHLSSRERVSESAEREAISWKKCQFMRDKVGEEFWGFVTGAATFGFFVELEKYFVDGLVHVSSLKDDFYHFSEEAQALIGERTRSTYRIGDKVRITVERVDVERRQIDFKLIPDTEEVGSNKLEKRDERSKKKRRRRG
ncbi:MAG: ribonuclease R [Deltaproteobacteria bacterium]|nr:MAG: ribonuclease R [Deltaproteobacteria bacterium]